MAERRFPRTRRLRRVADTQVVDSRSQLCERRGVSSVQDRPYGAEDWAVKRIRCTRLSSVITAVAANLHIFRGVSDLPPCEQRMAHRQVSAKGGAYA